MISYTFENRDIADAIAANDEALALQQLQAFRLNPAGVTATARENSPVSLVQAAAKKNMFTFIVALCDYYNTQADLTAEAFSALLPNQDDYPIAFAIATLKSKLCPFNLATDWVRKNPQYAAKFLNDIDQATKNLVDEQINRNLRAIRDRSYGIIYKQDRNHRIAVAALVGAISFLFLGPLCLIPALATYYWLRRDRPIAYVDGTYSLIRPNYLYVEPTVVMPRSWYQPYFSPLISVVPSVGYGYNAPAFGPLYFGHHRRTAVASAPMPPMVGVGYQHHAAPFHGRTTVASAPAYAAPSMMGGMGYAPTGGPSFYSPAPPPPHRGLASPSPFGGGGMSMPGHARHIRC